ncbi:MAG: hypothetical protein EA384_06470 [Spirochaetaceae bacterium]|nr:MAG: hypothetical protein EA384_06470 [Spirochaetaceae bacterium]
MTFDRDFYYNPLRRVEAERLMEAALHERWGAYGLGTRRNEDLPVIGAVHLAAGFMISEMLGCPVSYPEDSSPQVTCANGIDVALDAEQAFRSPVFRRFERLLEALKTSYGYLVGDVNWSGVLNVALDIWGQDILLGFYDDPQQTAARFDTIGQVIAGFTDLIQRETGSTSVSVNRNVQNVCPSLLLHSECALTMLSEDDYKRFLLPFDIAWSKRGLPYGVHYCGTDPHRFAASFSEIPRLDFLDVGWGADISLLRRYLPATFFNLRLSPVEFVGWEPSEIETTVTRLVMQSGDPMLTGVCCINLDDRVRDDQVAALLRTVHRLRRQLTGTANAESEGPYPPKAL